MEAPCSAPSSASSGSSSISRLPRFTPRRPLPLDVPHMPNGPLSALQTKNPPEFKQPKHPSVQALSLAIKKRYSSGKRAPGTRGSPSSAKPAPIKRPMTSSRLLGKRPASENQVESTKKPRVLVESNRPAATRRPGATAPDTNKATASQKTVGKSRVKKSVTKENADTTTAESAANTTSQKRKIQPWDFKGKLELSQETVRKLKEELESTKNRVKVLEDLGGSAESRLSTLTAQLAEEKALSSSRLEDIKERNQRIDSLTNEVRTLKELLVERNSKIEDLESNLARCQKRCEEQANEIDKLHDTRKVLHNQVQDLKGNIRVLCRVRPPTPKETSSASPLCHIEYNDMTSLELYKLKDEMNAKKKTSNNFSFDRVFPASSTQEEIYAELEQLVQSCLDGYNVCVFAYGQTGSGKTFTMDGIEDPENQRGMIPRTVDTIFNKIDTLKHLGWEYSVEVFFVEIYNEQIHDLLNYNSGLTHEVRMVPNKKNDVFVSNLRVEPVRSQQELNDLMALARNNRFVASTVCNTHSSRSHFIMKLAVSGTNAKRQLSCSGSISLVDLAGSERYEDNNSVDRRRETMSINKSLSSLGNVIMALKQKNDHVPYRVSKLTHLLMPCLGGSSKTLMIVNISPLKECFSESVNSLRFANCVNQCQVVAKKNEKTTATL